MTESNWIQSCRIVLNINFQFSGKRNEASISFASCNYKWKTQRRERIPHKIRNYNITLMSRNVKCVRCVMDVIRKGQKQNLFSNHQINGTYCTGSLPGNDGRIPAISERAL